MNTRGVRALIILNSIHMPHAEREIVYYYYFIIFNSPGERSETLAGWMSVEIITPSYI